jgi:hypothetical protein
MFFSRIDSSTWTSWCCTGAASMSSQKKARGLPGMKEGPMVQMLDRQRVTKMVHGQYCLKREFLRGT